MDYKFQLNDLTIFHKIYHGKYSVGLPPFIHKYTDMNDLNSAYFQRQTRTYNDSDRHKVKCILAPKVNSFKNSFFVRSARSWNSLPADIRSHDSIDSFKANLEKYFWNCLFPPDWISHKSLSCEPTLLTNWHNDQSCITCKSQWELGMT